MEEKRTPRQVRLSRNMTAKEASKKLEMPMTTYLRKEKGVCEFTYQQALNFCAVMGVKPEEVKF